MKICVQWPRFGPYHLARLDASHHYLAAHGVSLVGLETATSDAAYAWDTVAGASEWAYRCAFPGRDYRDIAPREMEDRVEALLDEIAPDAVAIHTYSLPDSRACLRWCRRNRRTAVLMWDSCYADAPRSGWWEALKSRIIHQYDAALAAGTDSVRYLERLGMPAQHISTGYDVVDNEAFAAAAEHVQADPQAWRHLPGLSNETPFFVCVSRYLALKNLDGLIRAYADYRRQVPDPWRLVIAGDGPERPALESLIAAQNISGVTLTGFMQLDTLPAYYACAQALLHPAHKDTWGLVVNEAMACGLPVIVSRESGCVTDLVQEGVNGFTFQAADEKALTGLMVRAHENPALPQMGSASKRIIADWNLNRFASGLLGAVQAGQACANRTMSADVKLVYLLLRLLARKPDAFHQTQS